MVEEDWFMCYSSCVKLQVRGHFNQIYFWPCLLVNSKSVAVGNYDYDYDYDK